MNEKLYYFKRYWAVCLLLLFSATTALAASPFEQQLKDFSIKNSSLKSAIEQVLRGSGYDIIYTVKDLDVKENISMEFKGVTIESALNSILSKLGLSYVIKENNVVISKAIQQDPKKMEITGKVIVAGTKDVIAGATIIISSTNSGAITDHNGNFKLTVKAGDKIEVSFLGMKRQILEIKPTDKNFVIELVPDAVGIDEVIVTGYQTTTKNRTTGSVAVINESELKGAPLQSMDMLMQGKVAGVNVQAVSGKPGETAKIRIRGTNTMTGNAEPLWVVDGIMLQKDIPQISSLQIKAGDFSNLFSNGIAGINPNDIESITILKDASAAAIYGSRAASGVIVVTTKRGKEGRLNVSYSGNMSVTTKPVRDANLMNSSEKLSWENELWNEFSKSGFEKGEYYPIIGITGMVRSGYRQFKGMSVAEQENYLNSLAGNSTDWLNELFRTSISHSHYLSFAGGSDKTTYYISTGYGKTNGLQKKNSYDHMNLNSKINFKLNKKLSLDFNTALSYQKSKDASASIDTYQYAYFANPYEKPYNEDGSYRADETYFEMARANGDISNIIPDNGINIMREFDETSQKTKNFAMTQIVSLNWNIHKNLRFEGIGSFSYTTNNAENINGIDSYAAFSDRPFDDGVLSQRRYGSIAQNSTYNSSYSLRGQFSYNKDFGTLHSFSALAGSEVRNQYSKGIFSKRYGYDPVSGNSSMPTFDLPEGSSIDYNRLVAYARIMDGLGGQTISESAVASFYFSTDYSFDKRYTVSFTARTDGSDNFGSKEQFNPVWSFGGLWNIRNERFMEGKASAISRFSLRAATGYTGNINKSVYPQFVMNYSTDYRKYQDEIIRIGEVRAAPNANLRWERTFDYKVGLDMGFFKNRLNFSVEAYNRLSSDVVTNVAVPYSTGFSSQSYNTSKILNRGLELTIGATILKNKNWVIDASVNGSYNQNILQEYIAPNGSISGSNYVGYPLNSIFGGNYSGIDPYTGVYMFKERKDAVLNTEKDYINADNYLFYLGTSTAPVAGGYNLNVRYKQLSLGIGGTYSIGGKILNQIKSPASYSKLDKLSVDGERVPTSRNDLYVNHLNVSRDATNRWREENKITSGYPRIIDALAPVKGYETFMTTSSKINDGAFLESVSYFKINSISLSYSLGEKATKKMGIGSMGFSFIANNILTISNYTGVDPEVPGAIYPQSQSFSIGLNIGF